MENSSSSSILGPSTMRRSWSVAAPICSTIESMVANSCSVGSSARMGCLSVPMATNMLPTRWSLAASAILSLCTQFRIFLRCKRCSTPSVFFRSSSLRSYRNSPSTAASTNASEYWPSDSVCSHLAQSSTLQEDTCSDSWPGSAPGFRAGRNLSLPPNWSGLFTSTPPGPTLPPSVPGICLAALCDCTSDSAAITVSCADTVRIALIIFSDEK
mmetsp:Transcript_24407/g.41330  ORF Transcript_24407/g.41330 Transcript_24407/m.41330 type:complete len:213 (+) Transcript_24407:560-1198(+)